MNCVDLSIIFSRFFLLFPFLIGFSYRTKCNSNCVHEFFTLFRSTEIILFHIEWFATCLRVISTGICICFCSDARRWEKSRRKAAAATQKNSHIFVDVIIIDQVTRLIRNPRQKSKRQQKHMQFLRICTFFNLSFFLLQISTWTKTHFYSKQNGKYKFSPMPTTIFSCHFCVCDFFICLFCVPSFGQHVCHFPRKRFFIWQIVFCHFFSLLSFLLRFTTYMKQKNGKRAKKKNKMRK